MLLERTINKLKTGKPLLITALGDSLTFGWMVKKGYLAFLQEMLSKKYPSSEIDIINRGIPGDTMEGGLYRLQNQVINTQPDLILIQFGLNDAFCGYPVSDFQDKTISMVRDIKTKTDSEILLMTSSALNENDMKTVEKYYDIIVRTAEKEKISIAKVHNYWTKNISDGISFNTLVQDDKVHPTEAGYCLIAEAIMEHL